MYRRNFRTNGGKSTMLAPSHGTSTLWVPLIRIPIWPRPWATGWPTCLPRRTCAIVSVGSRRPSCPRSCWCWSSRGASGRLRRCAGQRRRSVYSEKPGPVSIGLILPSRATISFKIRNLVWHLVRNYVRIRVEGIRIETKRIEMVVMPPNPTAKISKLVKTWVVIIIR